MIQLVVADMDGTLLNDELTISPRNQAAINAIRARGIHFAFATGRPDQLMKEYVDQMEVDGPIIMCNGSIVGHPLHEERLFEELLDADTVQQVVEYCESRDMIYMIYTREQILCKPNFRSNFFVARGEALPAIQRPVFTDLSTFTGDVRQLAVNKILIVEPDQDTYAQAKQELIRMLPNHRVLSSQNTFIDVNPNGTSKGRALRILCDHYDIELDAVVAFGDQENDIEMLQEAGIGVAMANAKAPIQAVADEVTARNTDDGFARWIETNLLR